MKTPRKHNWAVEMEIAKHKERMSPFERRNKINRICRALDACGYQITPATAEAIMWHPHWVVRRDDGNVVYDCPQPLCMSSSDLLGHRAVIALDRWRRRTGKQGRRSQRRARCTLHEQRRTAAKALARYVGNEPWSYMHFEDWKNCAEALFQIDYVRANGDWSDINSYPIDRWESLRADTRRFIAGVEQYLSEHVDPDEWAAYGPQQATTDLAAARIGATPPFPNIHC